MSEDTVLKLARYLFYKVGEEDLKLWFDELKDKEKKEKYMVCAREIIEFIDNTSDSDE